MEGKKRCKESCIVAFSNPGLLRGEAAQQASVVENSPAVQVGHAGIDQKLPGLIRYGNLHLGLPGNLCLKIVHLLLIL